MINKAKYQIVITTIMGTIVYKGLTTKDCSRFIIRNDIRTRMQLKYGDPINIQYISLNNNSVINN